MGGSVRGGLNLGWSNLSGQGFFLPLLIVEGVWVIKSEGFEGKEGKGAENKPAKQTR